MTPSAEATTTKTVLTTRTITIKEIQETQAYHNFIESIRSEETKREYTKGLLRYLSYCKKTVEELLSLSDKEVESMIITYLIHLKKKGLSQPYIGMNLSSLKHFYSMNDFNLNTHKIGKYLGESRKKYVDRCYTHSEIKNLLDISDMRFKVIVSILASTGIRIGALPQLKLSHIEKKDSVYKFTIYENSSEQYITFCTPECANHINNYLDFRERSGEELTKASYLIREQFDINDIEQIRKHVRPITKASMRNILIKLTIRAGIRTINHSYMPGERKSVPLNHGFRKFVTTQLVNSKVNPEIREMLLGHKIGLASAYYKPTEDEMLAEYEKAIDVLTIDPSQRLQRKVEILQIEKNQFDKLAAQIAALEKKMK